MPMTAGPSRRAAAPQAAPARRSGLGGWCWPGLVLLPLLLLRCCLSVFGLVGNTSYECRGSIALPARRERKRKASQPAKDNNAPTEAATSTREITTPWTVSAAARQSKG